MPEAAWRKSRFGPYCGGRIVCATRPQWSNRGRSGMRLSEDSVRGRGSNPGRSGMRLTEDCVRGGGRRQRRKGLRVFTAARLNPSCPLGLEHLVQCLRDRARRGIRRRGELAMPRLGGRTHLQLWPAAGCHADAFPSDASSYAASGTAGCGSRTAAASRANT